jgi:hypothetical protein
MVPTEQHEQHADGRWKQHKAVLGERVGKYKSAAIMHADLVESLLVISVQRRKVDIRGRLVDIYIVVRSAEHAALQSDDQDMDAEKDHVIVTVLTCE